MARLVILSTLVAGGLLSACAPTLSPDAATVILVHGLGRTPASMSVLSVRLRVAGFRVVNFGYPSISAEIEDLVDSLDDAVARCCGGPSDTTHFVTHSLGGVLVRSYLADRAPGFTGRVVMLSPPNKGSEFIDAFNDSPLLRSLLGPVAARLGTDPSGIAQELGPIDFSLGIITGDRSINPIGSWLIPGPDDGKVGVDSARLDGAADFIVVSATHTFIMNRGDVAEEIVYFLTRGTFTEDGNRVDSP